MSRDTDFNLTFVCPSQERLEELISYLDRKEARWDAWEQRGKSSKALLKRIGAKHYGAVVSWGFNFGEIQVDNDGEATVEATAWANQNLTNVHISGEKGELADLVEKFPDVEVTGTYKNEYGDGGEISGYEEC